MDNQTENYCQLLGLDPFGENKYSLDKINEKIDKMEVKWANEFRNKQNDTGQRFKYHKLLDQIPNMRRCMADPVLRRKVFADGKKSLEGKCQKLKMDCVILSDGRYFILPGIADNFVKRLHWDGVNKAQVLKLAGVTDGGIPKIVSEKVLNAFTNLTTVDSYTPVEVLNTLINNPDLEIRCDPLTETSSLAQIRNAFDLCEKRVNSVRQELLLDQDSYISVLRSMKLIIDSDKDFKDLINYGRCYKALEPVMDRIEGEYNGQQISRTYIDDLMNIYVRGLDQNMCVFILEMFCHKKRIAANFSKMDSTMIRCPTCNSMVPGGKNTIYCPYCGKNFKIVCPQCSTAQMASNNICIKCGFNFKEGETKAQNLSLSFQMDLQRGNLSKAEKELTLLKDTYSTFPGIAAMEIQLRKEQGTLNTLRGMVSDGYKTNKFYSAKSAGDTIVAKYPYELQTYPDIKQKYEESLQHVEHANVYCEKAKSAEDRNEMLSLYVGAAQECPDHPVAKGVLKQYPPAGPVDPNGKVLRDKGHFLLKFEPPMDSKGVTYMIYREKNSLPNVTDETRPLTEISGTAFIDKSLEPGVEYHYSVYSRRWGILSREAAHFGPVIILAEVDNVTIEQIDGGLRLMYDKPRGATQVRVWRADNVSGTNVELPINGESVYDDLGLKGGQTYYYLFVAEYQTRNKIERSEGNVFSGTPVDAPKPVRDLDIQWMKTDGTYQATWSTKSQVMLFSSEKKYTIQGNMVKMEDIKAWMNEIQPVVEYDNGCRFFLPDGAVEYIYPIIPMGKVGIKGTEVLIANLKPFRDVEKIISNKDCILTMTWPEDAISAKLVVSTSDAKNINDPTAEIITVSREEYNEEKLIRIPMGRSPKKCINIFAVYKINNDTMYSRGIVIDVYSSECKKVYYTLDPAKRRPMLELTAGPEVTSIPEIAIVRVDVGIPLRKEDGEVLWSSGKPVTFTNGKCSLDVILAGHTDAEHMRVFFVNEEDYNLYRFIHPLYNRRQD